MGEPGDPGSVPCVTDGAEAFRRRGSTLQTWERASRPGHLALGRSGRMTVEEVLQAALGKYSNESQELQASAFLICFV